MQDDYDDDFIEDVEPVEEEYVEEPDDDAELPTEYVHETEHSTVELILREEEHMTSQLISMFELAELINIRSRQISASGIAMIKTDADDSVQIAKQELAQRRCPLMLKRLRGRQKRNGKFHNVYEIWDPNKMTFPKQLV